MFETMIQVKRNSRLGYSNSKRGEKETSNRRIRYTKKLENNGWAVLTSRVVTNFQLLDILSNNQTIRMV